MRRPSIAWSVALVWACAAGRALAGQAGPCSASSGDVPLAPLKVGVTRVIGFFGPPEPQAPPLMVEVRSGAGAMRDRVRVALIDGESRRFEVPLTAALADGDVVTVHRTPGTILGCAHIKAPTATLPPAPDLTRLVDGAQVVRGFAKGEVKRVEVSVYAADPAERVWETAAAANTSMTHEAASAVRAALERRQPVLFLERVTVTTIGTGGAFTAPLTMPLIAGQMVEARAFGDLTEGEPSDPAWTEVIDPGNWGRVRAYFAAGSIFSKKRESFSAADMALTFVVDKSWLQADPFTLSSSEEQPRAAALQTARASSASESRPAERRVQSARIRPRQFNTFLDVRMTAIPVPAPETDEAAGAAPAAAASPDALGTFIGTRKGALVQIGAYLPIYGRPTTWIHEGKPNALFVAPVVRAGIQTLTGEETTFEATRYGGDDVFSFLTFGLGVGHFELGRTRNRAPEVVSYLHVTWGRFEQFEIHPDPERPDVRARPWRTAIEGRLRIPNTPMQVGIDANIGRKGGDQVAFVVGLRFDVGELFAKLPAF